MDKKSILRGIILGVAAPLLVALLFTAFMVNPDVGAGLKKLDRAGQIDTVLRIGLLANLVFFMMVVRKNEYLARGLVLSTLVLLTISLFLR
jgi:hypothetical protein